MPPGQGLGRRFVKVCRPPYLNVLCGGPFTMHGWPFTPHPPTSALHACQASPCCPTCCRMRAPTSAAMRRKGSWVSPSACTPCGSLTGRPQAPVHCEQFGGATSETQLAWLRASLLEAAQQGQRVLVLSHLPLHPATVQPACLMWNFQEVLDVLHAAGSTVAATIAGHAHQVPPPGYRSTVSTSQRQGKL